MSDDLKRYDMRAVGSGYPEAFESDGGIWVDYNDHTRIMSALLAERDALLSALELTRTRDEHVNNCRLPDCRVCADLQIATVRARCEALGRRPTLHTTVTYPPVTDNGA